MKVLVLDVGGTYVRICVTGQRAPTKFPSGPTMTPDQMVACTHKITRRWKYEVVSIGYPRLGDNANAFIGGFRLWETGKTAICRLSESALPANGKPKQGSMWERQSNDLKAAS